MNFSKFIENRIANIQSSDSFAFAAAIGLGPWLGPLAPAIVFGYALYISAPADMAEFRIVTAIAIAIGLIVAGAVSSHTAIVAGGLRPWSLVIGYIFLEIIGLWLMSISFDVKIVGTVASLITLIVYLSRSSAKQIDLAKSETKEVSQVKRDFQLEQAQKNADHKRHMAEQAAELKHALALAKIEAKKANSDNRQLAGNLPEETKPAGNLPEWLPMMPESLSHFRHLVGNGSVTLPEGLSGADLARVIGRSPRTGQNWLAQVQNGNGVAK